MVKGRLGIWLALLLACQACKHRATVSESSGAEKPKASHFSPLNPGAFDLASADEGAVLVVAERAGLRLVSLDRAGKATKSETLYRPELRTDAPAGRAPPPFEVRELVTATLGTRLAVVWLEQDRSSIRVRGLSGPRRALSNPPLSIGTADAPIASPRGNLAVGAVDDHFVLLTRAGRAACADPTERDCLGFSFFQFEAPDARHGGPPLAVPSPCAENALSFVVAGARFYYGVCSASTGKPITTLFTIQNEPSYYARSDRVLEGCSPTGAVAVGDDLVVAGQCSATRRAIRLRGIDRAPEEVYVDRLEAVCQSGKPLIRQLGTGGLQLPLGGRQDRLEAFLPVSLALPGARAVWTGQTLLVAGVVDSRITLKGYRCDSTLLREVSLD
jgi:hypothetical protein